MFEGEIGLVCVLSCGAVLTGGFYGLCTPRRDSRETPKPTAVPAAIGRRMATAGVAKAACGRVMAGM